MCRGKKETTEQKKRGLERNFLIWRGGKSPDGLKGSFTIKEENSWIYCAV